MNAKRTTEEIHLEDKETPVCPECGHSEMDTRWEDCPFPYGSGADAVEIPVRLPVRKCRKCGFEFFDEEAEDLSHEAVCHYLGRLTPKEIKALRAKYQFSRVELARLTGLGEATIPRWERGELIQNAGNDSLLWLLHYQENVDRLRMRQQKDDGQSHDPSSDDQIKRCIRRLGDQNAVTQQKQADSLNFYWIRHTLDKVK